MQELHTKQMLYQIIKKNTWLASKQRIILGIMQFMNSAIENMLKVCLKINLSISLQNLGENN